MTTADEVKRGDFVVALLALSDRVAGIADPTLDRHTGGVHDPVAVVADLRAVASVVGRLLDFAAAAKSAVDEAGADDQGSLILAEEDADRLIGALGALGFDPSAVDFTG